MDTGSGLDDKCVFVTDQGEVVIFAGTDPTASANWRQEGCYDISRPLGKNAHVKLGGDILVATLDGIVPLTATMQKDVSALSLAAITYNIEPMWTREFMNKRIYPWALAKWDEASALLVTFPGKASPTMGIPTTVSNTVGVSNLHTGAWCRYVGWDALCFMQINGSLFFGTQDGKIMQAESGGRDDTHWDATALKDIGNRYVCTMVGGWEMFQVPPNQVTWLQARAAFFSSAREPFEPQLSATVDYGFVIPPPPDPGPDPGLLDVWDQGLVGTNANVQSAQPSRQGSLRAVGSARCWSSSHQEHHVGVDRRDGIFACANRAGERRAADKAKRRACVGSGNLPAHGSKRVRWQWKNGPSS